MRLRWLRSDLIAAYHGRIAKRTGDGSLIALAAWSTRFAARSRWPTGLSERNVGAPAERRIEFRVGIHLGAALGPQS